MARNLIEVHGASTQSWPFMLQCRIGGTLAQIDLSARTLVFEAPDAGLSKPMGDDPDNTAGKLLTLDPDDIAALPSFPIEWAVIDVTDPAPVVRFEGQVMVGGYRHGQ